MNSRRIIENTIRFEKPSRIGMFYWLSNNTWDSDIVIGKVIHPLSKRNIRIEESLEFWEDEWNNLWARVVTDKTTKGEIRKGAIEHWDMLKNYNLPDFQDTSLYEGIRDMFAANPDKYKLGSLPGFCFSIVRKLRGLENFLMDIKLEADNVIRLMHLVEILLESVIVKYAEIGADGIFFCEDWGTQERLLISPADWVLFFKPVFQRLCMVAEKHKLSVWMHSCGYIYDIIPHLIEAGVDVLQLDQPELMGLEKLANYRGKVTFWSPCDIQKVLPTGDRGLIEKSISAMFENLSTPAGGLIAKSYGGSAADLCSIGTNPADSDFAHDCFFRYGRRFYGA
ncbi:MAG: methylcobalamin:coenzyme M methyltransferase [Planctomycetes bacterium ADurb.Bin401]|nr:MAG: methylcobalamin:coenzyme M methyltransferase [Planctomycetes bacterium ADurb.Bin401]